MNKECGDVVMKWKYVKNLGSYVLKPLDFNYPNHSVGIQTGLTLVLLLHYVNSCVGIGDKVAFTDLGPLLLTWINFNLSMDK